MGTPKRQEAVSFPQIILEKKAALAGTVNEPLARLAGLCAPVWPDADALDRVLLDGISTVRHCQLLYAWNIDAIEISSMVRQGGIDPSWRGRDLSQRPYLKNHLPFKGVMLSSAYESAYTHVQCITALQAVSRGKELLGFIAADFGLNDLLLDARLSAPRVEWKQFRGDPAVRGTVFMQSRVDSILDKHIEEVLARIDRLMRQHGIFHCKIHFSSGRCTLWVYEDPYNYRIHSVDEITDPDVCLAYPLRPYPEKAKTKPEQIMSVLRAFKALRFADDTIYLRSGSLNIMNGMTGLTFSCDGAHYMAVDEFLEKDLDFWLGNLGDKTGTRG